MKITPTTAREDIPTSIIPYDLLKLGFSCAPVVKRKDDVIVRISGYIAQSSADDYITQITDRVQTLGYSVDILENFASISCHGLIGFDIDIKNDKNGEESFKNFQAKYNLPDSNFIIKTKSGGFHAYYKIPEGKDDVMSPAPFKDADGVVYTGLDIRSGNSILFCPIDSESPYKIHVCDITHVKDITEISPEAYAAFKPIRALEISRPTVFESQIEIPDCIEGERNASLYRLCCKLISEGKLLEEVMEAGEHFAYTICFPPLDTNETYATIQSAWAGHSNKLKERLMRECRATYLQWAFNTQIILIDCKNCRTDRSLEVVAKTESSRWTIDYYDFWGKTPENDAKNKPVNLLIWMGKNGLLRSVERKGYRPGAPMYIPIDQYMDKALGQEIKYMYNTYKPPVFPKVTASSKESEEYIKDWLELCLHLCSNNQKDLDLFLDWLAFVVQNPTSRISFAPYFISYQGAGRGTVGYLLSYVLGEYNVAQITYESMLREHNADISDKRLVWIDEMPEYMSPAELSKFEGLLNSLITEKSYRKRMMYKDSEKAENYACVMITTNYPTSMRVNAGVRRIMPFMQMNRDTGRPEDAVYARLDRLKSRFNPNDYSTVEVVMKYAAHLHNYLKHRNLSMFNSSGFAPKTSSSEKLAKESASPLYVKLSADVTSRRGVFKADITSLEAIKTHLQLHYPNEKYSEYQLKRMIGTGNTPTDTQLFLEIKDPTDEDTLYTKISHPRIAILDRMAAVIKFESRFLREDLSPPLLSVRNHQHWNFCTPEEILTEYLTISGVGVESGLSTGEVNKLVTSLGKDKIKNLKNY